MNNQKKEPLFIKDFNYVLPDSKIAKYPLEKRDESKLLYYQKGSISQDIFKNISNYLSEKTLLVYNNTRVIQARLFFQKPTGAKIEIFCLEPSEPSDYALSLSSSERCTWKCMVGNSKKWKGGILQQTFLWQGIEVVFTAERRVDNLIEFSWNNKNVTFADILTVVGELPIPPYLNRKSETKDKKTYQTVYSKIDGSVAAPTAGLHFTDEVLKKLKNKNIGFEELTLHVGAGTFKPVQSESIDDHTMHTERIIVTRNTIENIIANLGNITAVGTTSVRTLETLYFIGVNIANHLENPFFVEQWQPYQNKNSLSTEKSLQEIITYMSDKKLDFIEAETQILIQPGYTFHLVNSIITNFHQPKSTLLLLVSAFIGNDWEKVYDYALKNDFRFLSYGDSSLLKL